MTRKEHPLEGELFKKLYACTYEKAKSGYDISNDIYGYPSKSSHLIKIIKKYPGYFKTIEKKGWKYPKYLSKAEPFVDILTDGIDISLNTKRKLVNSLNDSDFRSLIKFNKFIRNFDDMILTISFLSSSLYVFRKFYQDKIEIFKKLGFTPENQSTIIKNFEKEYRKKCSKVPDEATVSDYIVNVRKVTKFFEPMPNKLITHLMKRSPIIRILPDTAVAVLLLNDLLWELRIAKNIL